MRVIKECLKLFLAVCICFALVGNGWACTVGVATGAATIDGRPLVFKNRDVSTLWKNNAAFFDGDEAAGQYDYVCQKNVNDTSDRARSGVNAAGLCVVYADSENLPAGSSAPTNSQLCATMLRTCATLVEVRALLNTTNGDWAVAGHFAVADAAGQGAIFEISKDSYYETTVIDGFATRANTARFHPDAGSPATGSTSLERETRAGEIMAAAPGQGIDYRYMIQAVTGNYARNQIDEDNMPMGEYETNAVLSRYKTISATVIRGSKPGDDSRIESVLWAILGEPAFTIAVPLFTNCSQIPDLINCDDALQSGIVWLAHEKKKGLYEEMTGDGGVSHTVDSTMNTDMLPPLRAVVGAINGQAFQDYELNLSLWRNMTAKKAGRRMQAWQIENAQWMYDAYEYESMPKILSVEEIQSSGSGGCFIDRLLLN